MTKDTVKHTRASNGSDSRDAVLPWEMNTNALSYSPLTV